MLGFDVLLCHLLHMLFALDFVVVSLHNFIMFLISIANWYCPLYSTSLFYPPLSHFSFEVISSKTPLYDITPRASKWQQGHQRANTKNKLQVWYDINIIEYEKSFSAQ